MLPGIVWGLFFVAGCGGMVFAGLRPAAAIWRGDANQVPRLGSFSVNARCYLAFLLWFVPVFGGLSLIFIVVTVGTVNETWGRAATSLGVTGLVLMFIAIPFIGLHWFVSAFARPKFLIPPPYRGQRGFVADIGEHLRRRRSGLPPTDHLVEIHDVRPLDPAEHEPYLVAICTEPDCGWFEFSDDKLIGPSEEEQVRERAAKHSTFVAAELRRPLH